MPLDNDALIRSEDDLVAIFHDTASAGNVPRIGPEAEKFGIYGATLAPLHYEGGVLRVLETLRTQHGWEADFEKAGGPLIALKKNDASVTLEPGCQLELSGAPAADIHGIRQELREHFQEIRAISDELGVRWLGLGFHPFAKREDLAWVPKARYGIMKRYLPTRGGHAIDMMLRTSTVQANLDYDSEVDAMRKVRVSQKIAPLCAALFANSPYLEGRRGEALSMRARVWLDVDPDRSGLLPALWTPKATYADYAAWALDIPMFLVKRGTEVLNNTGQTFRAFWKDGFEGHKPTLGDWQLHLNTLFPEVRLKRTIEIRSADAQGAELSCAVPALYAGLLYDERALGELDALTEPWSFDEVSALRAHVWKDGLRSPFRGALLAQVAEAVVTIAEGGLERRARKDAQGKDERIYLAALKALVARGLTPAEALLEQVGDDPKKGLLDAADLMPLAS